MHILCTNHALTLRGGSQSYLETVIPELVALGHDVTAWSPYRGPVSDRLVELGYRVPERLEDVDAVDVIHAQHASTALAARRRFPEVPMVFASHSWVVDIEDPPVAADPAALLAFNDVVAARLRSSRLGERVPVHRLRQPVTISAMEGERVPIGDHRLIGVLINRDRDARLELLAAACRETGIHLETPTRSREIEDTAPEMMRADIVFAVGRTALEAMALSRAAFIFDQSGTAGFVTADSYGALEAAGFIPAPGPPLTLATLVEELRRYEPRLGQLGRELIGRHHAARAHAAQLVEIYRSVLESGWAPAGVPDVIDELAVLEQRSFDLERRWRDAVWKRARAERRVIELQDELDRIWNSMSWRITKPLRSNRRS